VALAFASEILSQSASEVAHGNSMIGRSSIRKMVHSRRHRQSWGMCTPRHIEHRNPERCCQRWTPASDERCCKGTARLIGDKAYDSDPLDEKLASEYGIELIAPNRRRRSKSQDGRKLRRYRRRWKVERLFAWVHNFRRLVTRWEYRIENFLGFVQLACIHLMLRHL
jgi:transposase